MEEGEVDHGVRALVTDGWKARAEAGRFTFCRMSALAQHIQGVEGHQVKQLTD